MNIYEQALQQYYRQAYFFTRYQSRFQERCTIVLTCLVFGAGFAPTVFDLLPEQGKALAMLIGLVSAAFVYWCGSCLLEQDRALCFEAEYILGLVVFRKWFRWNRVTWLARFSDIAAVYVNARPDMYSSYQQWLYPVVLLTRDGREILMNETRVYEFSLAMGQRLSEHLNCDFVFVPEETPMEIEVKNSEVVYKAKNKDVGLWGRLLVSCSLFALTWGLASLANF